MTEEKLVCAGFGGQGVLFIGRLLAYAGMDTGKNVSWIPSYGPEMRGGTANCTVIISDHEICSPIVPHPDSVIAMNGPSMEKFAPQIAEGGLLVLNKSMIDSTPSRKGLRIVEVKANDIARGLGNEKVMNMVMLGAYLKASNLMSMQQIMDAMPHMVSKERKELYETNKKAIQAGMDGVK